MVYSGEGFGSEFWGGGPWGGLLGAGEGGGGGGGAFAMLDALAVRENVVRLQFSVPPVLSGVLDAFDGLVASRYLIAVVNGTFGNDGLPVRPVRVVEVMRGPLATDVDLWLDRALSPYPSGYVVTATGLWDVLGEQQTVPFIAAFVGLYRGLVPPSADLAIPSRDFANPQSFAGLIDPLPNTTDARQLGTFPTDETGDVAFDEGMASYKKRVFRRLSTRKGAYLHLPEYGVTFMDHVKQLARPGMIQQLASEAEEQIKQEPETLSCVVKILQQGRLTVYQIVVKTNIGSQLTFHAPVQIQGV
jgi:hypothetical protein